MNLIQAKVEITEQTYANYRLLMGFFRFTGLLSVNFEKDGPKLFMKFSLIYLVFWATVAVFVIYTTFWGLYLDAKFRTNSIMSEATTDKLMFFLQSSQYSAVVVVGMIINGCRFGKIADYIKCINKVDSLIRTTYKNLEKHILLLVAVLIVSYNVTISSLGLKGCYFAYGHSLGLLEVLKRYGPMQIVVYIAWVSEYMNLVMLKSLETRIRKLNVTLELEYNSLESSVLAQSLPNRINKKVVVIQLHNKGTTIAGLSKVYMKIIKAADVLNDFLSLGFLATTGSLFWSLVYVAHFFMLTMTHARGEAGRIGELRSICMQICANTVRVLMLVNPPHDCLMEIEKTKALVCKILSCRLTRQYRKQVDSLAVVLGLRQLQFSACGFLKIDRFLPASLVDTIITLFMVLYQYRSSFEINF